MSETEWKIIHQWISADRTYMITVSVPKPQEGQSVNVPEKHPPGVIMPSTPQTAAQPHKPLPPEGTEYFPTPKQIAFAKRLGIKDPESFTKGELSQAIDDELKKQGPKRTIGSPQA